MKTCVKKEYCKYLACGVLLLHLGLVSFSAAYFKLSDALPFRKVFQFYAKASGADSSYGFFAPSVGSKVRALFDLVDTNGVMISNISFSSEMNREENIRLGGIFEEFLSDEADEEDFRQTLASSLAASAFSYKAGSVKATLHIQEFGPISMAEYRQGMRGDWEEIYTAKFIRTLDEETPR